MTQKWREEISLSCLLSIKIIIISIRAQSIKRIMFLSSPLQFLNYDINTQVGCSTRTLMYLSELYEL